MVDRLEATDPMTDGPDDRNGRFRRSVILERLGLDHWDALIVLISFGFLVAFAPPLFFDSWTPRMALLLLFGPLGLALLARLVVTGDLASRLLAGALGWTVVAAIASPAPRSALVGFVGRDLSALTVVVACGLWALGRQASHAGARSLSHAVLAGSSLCALVGVLQVVADVDSGPLTLLSGRPTGFVTNPVYFGAIASAGLALAVSSWTSKSGRWLLAPLLVLGVAVSLSGSRVALAAAVVTVVAHAAIRRDRSSWITTTAALLAMVAGVLLDRLVGAGNNAAARLPATDAAGSGRWAVWRYGLDAWIERPVRGYGFGRFRPAVQERFSIDFVRNHAPDDVTQAWFDPHNAVIGVLVAVGIVGLVLFAAWGWTWALRIRGPLAWMLVPIALHWMLQPVSLFTLPLAMLVFGAAGAVDEDAERAVRPSRTVVGLALGAGAVLGFGLLAADLTFADAADDLNGGRAADVANLLGDDPVVSDVVAQIYAANPDPGDPGRDLQWRRIAASSEPDRPYWWTVLAQRQIAAGDLDAARASVEKALELQPYNVRTSIAAASIARRTGDDAEFDRHMDLLCQLGFEQVCDLDNRADVLQPEDAP